MSRRRLASLVLAPAFVLALALVFALALAGGCGREEPEPPPVSARTWPRVAQQLSSRPKPCSS